MSYPPSNERSGTRFQDTAALLVSAGFHSTGCSVISKAGSGCHAVRFQRELQRCPSPRAQLEWRSSRLKSKGSVPLPHNSGFRVVGRLQRSMWLELQVSQPRVDRLAVAAVIVFALVLAGVVSLVRLSAQPDRQDPPRSDSLSTFGPVPHTLALDPNMPGNRSRDGRAAEWDIQELDRVTV